MPVVKGKIEVNISLNKTSCYMMQHGRCSLDIVQSMYISPTLRLAPNDLLYCPRLCNILRSREGLKPLVVMPCECGHAEVVTSQQRACVASKKRFEQEIALLGDESRETCRLCKGQLTFEQTGGNRNIVLRVRFKE